MTVLFLDLHAPTIYFFCAVNSITHVLFYLPFRRYITYTCAQITIWSFLIVHARMSPNTILSFQFTLWILFVPFVQYSKYMNRGTQICFLTKLYKYFFFKFVSFYFIIIQVLFSKYYVSKTFRDVYWVLEWSLVGSWKRVYSFFKVKKIRALVGI